jgi:hypothetical protein
MHYPNELQRFHRSCSVPMPHNTLTPKPPIASARINAVIVPADKAVDAVAYRAAVVLFYCYCSSLFQGGRNRQVQAVHAGSQAADHRDDCQ